MKRQPLPLIYRVALNQPVRRGVHRDIYVQPGRKGEPRVIEKVVRSHYHPDWGLFRVRIPMRMRAFLRYWAHDLNRVERDNYSALFVRAPPSLRPCFARVIELEKRSPSVLRMEPVLDPDHVLSLSLRQMGKVADPRFWETFDRMVEWMVKERIPFFDFNATNFMVQFLPSGSCRPVLVDYKGARLQGHALKPWLLIPAVAMRKVRQNYARMKKKYQASD